MSHEGNEEKHAAAVDTPTQKFPPLFLKNIDNPLHQAAFHGDLQKVRDVIASEIDSKETDEHGRNALHYAAWGGNLELFLYLLQTGKFDLKETDDHGANALHYAAWGGNLELFLYFIKTLKFDLRETDDLGATVLLYAARGGNLELFLYLLKTGKFDLKETDNHGATPLHYAAWGGQAELFMYLAKIGAFDPEAKDENGVTVLHYLARSGNIQMFKTHALKHDLEETDRYGATVLHYAVWGGSVEMYLYLTQELELDPEKTDHNGVHVVLYAARSGSEEMLAYVIQEKKIPLHTTDNNGGTLSDYAAFGGHPKMYRHTLKIGALNTHDLTNENGSTPLHYAGSGGHRRMISLLVQAFDPQQTNKEGKNVLYYTVCRGHIEALAYFISLGLDPRDENNSALRSAALCAHTKIFNYVRTTLELSPKIPVQDIWDALKRAIRAENKEMVILLYNTFLLNDKKKDGDEERTIMDHLAFYASPKMFAEIVRVLRLNPKKTTKWGMNALHNAACSNNLETVTYLIKKLKFDLEAVDQHGGTALHHAAANGNIEMMRHLIQLGAKNVTATTPDGRNALHLAAAHAGNSETIAYLIQLGLDPKATTQHGKTILDQAKERGDETCIAFCAEENLARLRGAYLEEQEKPRQTYAAEQIFLTIKAANNLPLQEEFLELITAYAAPSYVIPADIAPDTLDEAKDAAPAESCALDEIKEVLRKYPSFSDYISAQTKRFSPPFLAPLFKLLDSPTTSQNRALQGKVAQFLGALAALPPGHTLLQLQHEMASYQQHMQNSKKEDVLAEILKKIAQQISAIAEETKTLATLFDTRKFEECYALMKKNPSISGYPVSMHCTFGQHIAPALRLFLINLDTYTFSKCTQPTTNSAKIKEVYFNMAVRCIEASDLPQEEKNALYMQCANSNTVKYQFIFHALLPNSVKSTRFFSPKDWSKAFLEKVVAIENRCESQLSLSGSGCS